MKFILFEHKLLICNEKMRIRVIYDYDESDDIEENTIDINSFNEIKNKENIIYINCSNNELTTLKGIGIFENLKTLNCSHNN